MKRRGFVRRLLGALAVAPAVVLAKRTGAAPEVIEPIVRSTGGVDQFIATNVWKVPAGGVTEAALKPGPIVPLYTPDAAPLLALQDKMNARRAASMHSWIKEEYPTPSSIASAYPHSSTVESYSIGEVLGMESREVANEKYEWFVPADPPTYTERGSAVMQHDYNYLQIVRTPVAFAGRDMMTPPMMGVERRHALREHLRQIFYLLEAGKRARVMDREDGIHTPTTTGGRQFFGSTAKGRVAYMRNRGLVWRTWSDPASDVLHGEWLSDIGWAP